MFLDFCVQNMPWTWGTAEGRRMRVNCTQIYSKACADMYVSVCAYGREERRWEQKVPTPNFGGHSANWLLTVAMSVLDRIPWEISTPGSTQRPLKGSFQPLDQIGAGINKEWRKPAPLDPPYNNSLYMQLLSPSAQQTLINLLTKLL